MPNGSNQSDDLEKQSNSTGLTVHGSEVSETNQPQVTIVVCEGEEAIANLSKDVDSPKKGHLSRSSSSHEECRVCQQEKEEILIDLGCHCRGGLAKAHRSCIDTWFLTRGSNKCEICQAVATNILPPETQPITNYWVWRIDPNAQAHNHDRGCFSPLWVAFSILVGGLLLDVLISITLGVSALPVNIIIGVIVVLGLGTALRLALEFCHEWSVRRVVQRVETNANLRFHPAL